MNLGVGYRPKPSDDNVESTLVKFRHGDLGNWQNWVDRLDTFLEEYREIDKEVLTLPQVISSSVMKLVESYIEEGKIQ